ncbi:MAG: AI-2E family transporter [Oscillospiraceae bacterium]|nr:AI-2E family transporter [Oscillospiraceae bacterium]
MNISWKTCFRVGISALLLFLCVKYSDFAVRAAKALLAAVMPVIIAMAIAYIVNLPMSFYERHYFKKQQGKKWVQNSRRPICLTAAIITICAIVALVVWLVLPELIECVTFIISEIPPFMEKVLDSEIARSLMPMDVENEVDKINWASLVDSIMSVIKTGIGSAFTTVIGLVGSVFSGVFNAIMCAMLAVYFLIGKERLIGRIGRIMRSYMKPKLRKRVKYVLMLLNESYRKYIVGQCTEAVILGALCMLGMIIFRFPYAGMIGALVAFLALIPVAGAFIAAGVGALMILTVSPLKALLFVVFFIILQQLEGNLIFPKVVGKSVGLSAWLVLAAVTVGGALLGIGGMLISVPIASVLYRLLYEDVERREKKKEEITSE